MQQRLPFLEGALSAKLTEGIKKMPPFYPLRQNLRFCHLPLQQGEALFSVCNKKGC